MKNILLVLLAVLLVAAGSLLPMAAAYVQDKNTANVVQYANIEALRLKLEEEEPKISFQEKLSLIASGSGTEVAADMMRMQEEEVIKTAYAALQPYADMYGLLLDTDVLEYFPYMVWNENDPTVVAGYWHVYMSLASSENGAFRVILDDETGKTLAVDLHDPQMDISEAYLQKLQYTVSEAYFEGLELSPSKEWSKTVEEEYNNSEVQIATRYQLLDARYGEAEVEICVHGTGFYIIPA